MFGLSQLVSRIIFGLAVLLCFVGFLYVRSCQQSRQQAAESRLQRGQAEALSNSAQDAIATQGRSQAEERASEELTRQNEKEIRNAQGADDAVNPAVRDAGMRSLCRRQSYRDTDRCKLLRAPTP